MKVANKEIRQKINEFKIKQWMVAEYLNVHESTFNRWLRTEMPEKRKEQVMKAINQLKQDMQREDK